MDERIEDRRKPIMFDRLAVPLIGVIAAFFLIAPGFFWASNISTRLNVQNQAIDELKTRLQRDENVSTQGNTRLAVVEANYASVLSTLTDIKASLEKLESHFSLR